MEYNIINENDFPILEVTMEKDSEFKLETGAMLSMTNDIALEGKRNGSLLGALGKVFAGGENFFITTAKSSNDGEKINVAPKGFGSIKHIELDGNVNWYLEDGKFLASDPTVDIEVKRQKGVLTGLVGGTGGFFVLKTAGAGNLFIESFGSIIEVEVTPDKPITVDNSHVIGWEETVHHEIKMASGVFGFKTGEGLVIKLSGTGKVLIQSREIGNFAGLVSPYLNLGNS